MWARDVRLSVGAGAAADQDHALREGSGASAAGGDRAGLGAGRSVAQIAELFAASPGYAREDLDFDFALKEIKPSTRTWFQSARQVAQFANHDNAYDELVSYLRSRKQA